jgi:hypothetical protein
VPIVALMPHSRSPSLPKGRPPVFPLDHPDRARVVPETSHSNGNRARLRQLQPAEKPTAVDPATARRSKQTESVETLSLLGLLIGLGALRHIDIAVSIVALLPAIYRPSWSGSSRLSTTRAFRARL